jgi:hypothetical protein
MDLTYSNVDSRPLGIGVRSDAGWWVWATPGSWSTPFNPAAHVLACTPDTDLPTLQSTAAPAIALIPGSILVDFVQAGTAWLPSSTLNCPENYLGSLAPRGALTLRF